MSGFRPLRFPLPGMFVFVLLLWLAHAVMVGVIIAGMGAFGTVTHSVWDNAVQVSMWFAFGFTAWMTYHYLPVYLAHGVTRREYMARLIGFVLVLSAQLAALTALAYLAEWAAFRFAGWPQVLAAERHFNSATEVPVVLLTEFLTFAVFCAVGTLVGAGFYRGAAIGLPLILLSVAATGTVAISLGTGVNMFLGTVTRWGPASLWLGAPLSAAVVAVLLGLTWLFLRRIPVRPMSV